MRKRMTGAVRLGPGSGNRLVERVKGYTTRASPRRHRRDVLDANNDGMFRPLAATLGVHRRWPPDLFVGDLDPLPLPLVADALRDAPSPSVTAERGL